MNSPNGVAKASVRSSNTPISPIERHYLHAVLCAGIRQAVVAELPPIEPKIS